MSDTGRGRWLVAAILAGVLYLAIGIAPALLAASAASGGRQVLWRRLAFVLSAVVFAAHIAYERFSLRSGTRRLAGHTSLAVALGAFALALSANLHDLTSASGYRPRMLLSLVAWPMLTAVPAFFVALVVAAGLGARRPRG